MRGAVSSIYHFWGLSLLRVDPHIHLVVSLCLNNLFSRPLARRPAGDEFFQLLYSEKVFVLLFLKDIFAGHRIATVVQIH